MLFQFYGEKPLWIPLQWNMAFLIINGLMIGLLVKEAADGYNIPDDQKQLYIAVFENRGMKLKKIKISIVMYNVKLKISI
jgi:hypothetical protein